MKMQFIDTQLGIMLDEIKKAMIANFPIVYIPTNQLELIQELFYGNECTDAIIPRIIYEGGKFVLMKDKECSKSKSEDKNSMKEKKCSYSEGENYQVNADVPSGYSGCRNCPLKEKLNDEKKPKLSELDRPTLFINYTNKWDNVHTSAKTFVYSYMGIKRNFPIEEEQIKMFRRCLFVVVTPKELVVPEDLAPYTRTVHVPAISDEEIRMIICDTLKKNKINSDVISKRTLMRQMVVSFRGFASNGIKQILSQLTTERLIDNDYRRISEEKVLNTISGAKKQMLNDSVGLKWEKPHLTKVEGLDEITNWLIDRKDLLQDPDQARKFHMDVPQGLLVSGIPGTGKSLIAKTAASLLNMPLISLDMGALLGGLMGESEHNMINALKKAEQMSPCVLWIDEIEKAFSGSSQNSSSSDGGVGRRMFGKFLTWMQEKTENCFVFATSNDISCIPPELFRSERFDCKFFTFMPLAEECAAILSANIKKQNDEFSNDKKTNLLFERELEKPAVWLKFLNEHCVPDGQSLEFPSKNPDCEKPDHVALRWKDNKKPRFKLMTGADLSALIKLAKFEVYKKNEGRISDNIIYSKNDIINAMEDLFNSKKFKPYGETNIKDIVKCFKKLYDYEFVPASGKCIVDFCEYNSDSETMIYDPEALNKRLNVQKDEERHPYDQALYYMVAGAINALSKDSKNEIKK